MTTLKFKLLKILTNWFANQYFKLLNPSNVVIKESLLTLSELDDLLLVK